MALAAVPPRNRRQRRRAGDATTDMFDLWREGATQGYQLRTTAWDYHKAMKAFAPVIGAKPSSGALLGVAGNIAFYRGDPATTHISSVVTSLTFSTKGQTSLTDRITVFGRDDRLRLDADHRFQWTSLETIRSAPAPTPATPCPTDFDFFRLHHTAYYHLRPWLYAGGGLYFDNHINVGPHDRRRRGESGWSESPYVPYSEAHGLPLDSQASAGASVDVLWDSRDSFINAHRGWFAKVSYRTSFDGFLGGDSSWQRVNLDVRTYQPVVGERPSQDRRLALCRSGRRRRGAVPRSAGDGPRHLRTIGARLSRGPVPRRAAGLRRDRVSRHADAQRPARDGGCS